MLQSYPGLFLQAHVFPIAKYGSSQLLTHDACTQARNLRVFDFGLIIKVGQYQERDACGLLHCHFQKNIHLNDNMGTGKLAFKRIE